MDYVALSQAERTELLLDALRDLERQHLAVHIQLVVNEDTPRKNDEEIKQLAGLEQRKSRLEQGINHLVNRFALRSEETCTPDDRS